MKSIQIILLMCINIGESYPPHIFDEDIQPNLDYLVKTGLIEPIDRNGITASSIPYKITDKGNIVVLALYAVLGAYALEAATS